jgi:hypothetical protein
MPHSNPRPPPPITTRFSVSQARFGEGLVWTTTYTGTREALINACLVVSSQFPQLTKARSSANGAHQESGRWYLWLENPLDDLWSITYYCGGFVAELDKDGLQRLQRHLLFDLQITPDTIGAILIEWRKHADRLLP